MQPSPEEYLAQMKYLIGKREGEKMLPYQMYKEAYQLKQVSEVTLD